MTGSSSKRKILCLHGGPGSGDGFRKQAGMSNLIEDLKNDYEFIFISASGNNYSEDTWLNDGKAEFEIEESTKAINSIKYINQSIQNVGGVYGILGYSQGVAIILSYLAYTNPNISINKNFQKIFLFNGYIPEYNNDLMIYINNNIPFKINTLIYTATNDSGFYNFSKNLNNDKYFTNRTYIESSNTGHSMPSPTSDLTNYDKVKNFFKTTPPLSENQKYNNFLNTSYTIDYNDGTRKFVILKSDGKLDTSLNQNTTIIKKLFDDNGVVFTPNAWKQVKNYIFNYKKS